MTLTTPITLFPAFLVLLVVLHYLAGLPAGFIRRLTNLFKWACFLIVLPLGLLGGATGVGLALVFLVCGLLSWFVQIWAGRRGRRLAAQEAGSVAG